MDDSSERGRRSDLASRLVRFVFVGFAVVFAAGTGGCIGFVPDLDLFPDTRRGIVRHDQVWEGIQHVTGDLVIRGAEVRIRCGTHIQVANAAQIEIGRDARLVSAGRTGCPVVWTTQQDGPKPGDWGAIEVRDGGGFTATRTELEYGGADGAVVQVRAGGGADFEDVTFRRAAEGGLEVRPGGELERADQLEFVSVQGDSVRLPIDQLGRVRAPSFSDSRRSIVAFGGVVDESVRWNFPFLSIEIVGDVRIRARASIGEETRVRLFPYTVVTVESGGAIRALGDGRLSYRAKHRWVHLAFGPESRLEITSSAESDNLLRWTVLSGTGELKVADRASIRFDRAKVFGERCPSETVAEADEITSRRGCG